jgi:hypothetical protein
MENKPPTSPIRLRAIARAMREAREQVFPPSPFIQHEQASNREESREENWEAWAEQPTSLFPAHVLPLQGREQEPSLVLPLDEEGRPFVRIDRSCENDTLALVEEAVTRYRAATGRNPGVVELSAFRMLTTGCWLHFYYPENGDPIPYRLSERGASFDVLVK